MNQTELESLTIAELHALAKQNGIPSYRKYKKAELIGLIKASAPERPAPKKRALLYTPDHDSNYLDCPCQSAIRACRAARSLHQH